jgi:hypothetical protein
MKDDNMNQEKFLHIVQNQPIELRDRSSELFDLLAQYKIPLLSNLSHVTTNNLQFSALVSET